MGTKTVNYGILEDSEAMEAWEDGYGTLPVNSGYRRSIVQYFKTLDITHGKAIDGYVSNAKNDDTYHSDQVRIFAKKSLGGAPLSSVRLNMIHRAVASLLTMNNVDIKPLARKNIRKFLGRPKKLKAKNRPQLADLQKLLKDNPKDLRFRALLLTLASSGMRIEDTEAHEMGALVEHLHEEDGGDFGKFASIDIYSRKLDRVELKFGTPETYQALREYLKEREDMGEIIGPKSPLFRDSFWHKTGMYSGKVDQPQPLKRNEVRKIITERMWRSRIRTSKLDRNGSRHEWSPQGLRHYFKYHAENAPGSKTIDIEMLMGHTTGLHNQYFEAEKRDLVKRYIPLISTLTIDEAKRLKLQGQGQQGKVLQQQQEEIDNQKEQVLTIVSKLTETEKMNKDLEKTVEVFSKQLNKIEEVVPIENVPTLLRILKEGMEKEGIDIKHPWTKRR